MGELNTIGDLKRPPAETMSTAGTTMKQRWNRNVRLPVDAGLRPPGARAQRPWRGAPRRRLGALATVQERWRPRPLRPRSASSCYEYGP